MKKGLKVKMRLGPVGETILATIAVASLVTVAVCVPNALQLLKPFFKKKKYSPKQAVTRNIESLIRTGLVKKSINANGELVLELTHKGKWEHMLRSKNSGKVKWDDKWRVVIFDVPSTKNALRDQLTRGMRFYGFKLLQKSVWIYPYECDEFISILRKHFGLIDDVIYLTVSKLEHDKKWKKEFKL